MKGLLTVAWKNLRHRLPAAIGLVLLSAALFSGGSLLRAMVRSQTQALETMTEQTEITCVVTDATGTKTGGINVSDSFAHKLRGKLHESGCTIDEYVRDLRLTAREELASPERAVLIRANGPEAIGPDLKLRFADGTEETCLAGTELVCCISPNLADLTDENGMIRLERRFLPPVSLRVVGTVIGADSIAVCPFDAQLYAEGSESFLLDRCSFTLSDTRRLDEAKEALFEWFTVPSLTNASDPGKAGLLIQDAEYTAAAEEIRSHIVLLGRLRILLLLLSGALGLLTGLLMNRKRQREFAVMRCLGCKRLAVTFSAATEQLLPMLPGIAVGALIGVAVLRDGTGLADGFLQMLLYLCGGIACAWLLTGVEPIRLMKEEE